MWRALVVLRLEVPGVYSLPSWILICLSYRSWWTCCNLLFSWTRWEDVLPYLILICLISLNSGVQGRVSIILYCLACSSVLFSPAPYLLIWWHLLHHIMILWFFLIQSLVSDTTELALEDLLVHLPLILLFVVDWDRGSQAQAGKAQRVNVVITVISRHCLVLESRLFLLFVVVYCLHLAEPAMLVCFIGVQSYLILLVSPPPLYLLLVLLSLLIQ